jgi:hypothetical protein
VQNAGMQEPCPPATKGAHHTRLIMVQNAASAHLPPGLEALIPSGNGLQLNPRLGSGIRYGTRYLMENSHLSSVPLTMPSAGSSPLEAHSFPIDLAVGGHKLGIATLANVNPPADITQAVLTPTTPPGTSRSKIHAAGPCCCSFVSDTRALKTVGPHCQGPTNCPNSLTHTNCPMMSCTSA